MRSRIPGTWLVIALLASGLAAAGWLAATSVPAHSAAGAPDMRIDINRASAAELNVLPGIGPRLAERIVADREARGPFSDLDDLQRVGGIGPRTVDGIRGLAIAVP